MHKCGAKREGTHLLLQICNKRRKTRFCSGQVLLHEPNLFILFLSSGSDERSIGGREEKSQNIDSEGIDRKLWLAVSFQLQVEIIDTKEWKRFDMLVRD